MSLVDRRRWPRVLTLAPVTILTDGARAEGVCVDIGPGGAYVSSRVQPSVGSIVTLHMRPHGPKTPVVLLTAEVRYLLAGMPNRPPGFGIAWRTASSAVGAEPLQRLLREVLHVKSLFTPRVDREQGAWFEFAWLQAPEPPQAPVRRSPPGSQAARPAMATVQTVARAVSAKSSTLPALVGAGASYRAQAVGRTQIGAGLPRAASADPAVAAWPATVPRQLASRYANLRLVGRGAHGEVYSAFDRLAERQVALKFLAPRAVPDEMARAYFQREVRLLSSLAHPNIVRLHDIATAQGVLYLTMELVEGAELASWLPEGRPVSSTEFVLAIGRQLASAIDYAHEQGVVHRDIKPSNVLVTRQGRVKLVDFGLARMAFEGSGTWSQVVGTPHYMAPELHRKAKVDRRVDVYALGVLLFRTLTGRVPFDGDSPVSVCMAHVLEPIPDVRTFNPALAPAVSEVMHTALAKLPEQRYPTCARLMADLERALARPGQGMGTQV